MLVVGDEEAHLPPSTWDELSEDGDIRRLRHEDHVRVLVNSYTPGLAVRDEKTGAFRGFEVDLVNGLAASIFPDDNAPSSHVEFVEAPNDEKVDLLAENEVDLIVANMFDTPERRQKVDFAAHYLSARYVPLLAPNAPDVKRISDLAGLRVGVEAGSSDEETLLRIAPDAEIFPMGAPSQWLDALNNNRIDVFWGDTAVDLVHVRKPKSVIRQGSLRFGVGHSAIAVNKQKTGLRRFANAYVEEMLATGQLSTSLRAWGL